MVEVNVAVVTIKCLMLIILGMQSKPAQRDENADRGNKI